MTKAAFLCLKRDDLSREMEAAGMTWTELTRIDMTWIGFRGKI